MCSNENGCVGCIQLGNKVMFPVGWVHTLNLHFFDVACGEQSGPLGKSPVHAGRITAGVCWKCVPPLHDSRDSRFQDPTTFDSSLDPSRLSG